MENIVYCKNCQYAKYNSSADIIKCNRRGHYSEQVEPMDFCSKGVESCEGTIVTDETVEQREEATDEQR